jgi:predicted nucleic acid-binding protein
LVVTPVILGEVEFGIVVLDDGHRKRHLEEWFHKVVRGIQGVDLDIKAASAWARLLADLKKNGHRMPVKDSLIAASALALNLTVATRNTADFAHTGVKLVNPFLPT